MNFLAKNQRLVRITLIFWSLSFLYAIIFNNFTGWWLLLFISFIFIGLIISLLPSLHYVHGRLLQKSHPYQVQQATTLTILFTRKKRAFVPMFHFTVRLQTFEQLVELFLLKKQLSITWIPEKRGVFQTLPLTIESSDFLRLFTKIQFFQLTGPFVVYPVIQKQVAINLLQYLSLEKNNRHSSLGAQTFDVKNFRDYQYGDSLHTIDWKQSSKTEQLIVKEFYMEQTTSWVLIFYGISHKHFETILSIYYSVFLALKTIISFQQYLLADLPTDCPEDEQVVYLTPLKKEPNLPNIKQKKILLFSPTQTDYLKAQVAILSRENDISLVAIEKESLYLFQNNQHFPIETEVNKIET